MVTNPFQGYWRITAMDQFRQDFVDLMGPAFIRIEPGSDGSFQFGAVRGWLDHRIATEPDRARLEWSWQGWNDSDEALGRGWAYRNGTVLTGHFFIHGSDDSAFVASLQAHSRKRASSKTEPPRANTPTPRTARATRQRRA